MSSSFADIFTSASLEALAEGLAPAARPAPEPVPVSPADEPGDLLSSDHRDVRRALACSPEPQLVLEAWRKHLKLTLVGSGTQHAERLRCLDVLASSVPQPEVRFSELLSFTTKNARVLCPSDFYPAATTLLGELYKDAQQQVLTEATVELFSRASGQALELVFGDLLLPVMDHPDVDVSSILLALTPHRARRLVTLAREECAGRYRHLSSMRVSGVLAAHLFDSCTWLVPRWGFSGCSSDAFGMLMLDASCASWVSSHPRQFACLLEANLEFDDELVEALADTAPASVLRLMLCSPDWDFRALNDSYFGLAFRFVAGLARRLDIPSCRFSLGSSTVTLALKPSSDASNETKPSKLRLPAEVFASTVELAAYTDAEFLWEPPATVDGAEALWAAVAERRQLVEAFASLLTAAWPWVSDDGTSDEFAASFQWLCNRTSDHDQALVSWLPGFVASASDDLWDPIVNALLSMEVSSLLAAILVELPPGRLVRAWNPTEFDHSFAEVIPELLKVLPVLSPDMAPVFVGLLPGWEGTLRELAESVSALSA